MDSAGSDWAEDDEYEYPGDDEEVTAVTAFSPTPHAGAGGGQGDAVGGLASAGAGGPAAALSPGSAGAPSTARSTSGISVHDAGGSFDEVPPPPDSPAALLKQQSHTVYSATELAEERIAQLEDVANVLMVRDTQCRH